MAIGCGAVAQTSSRMELVWPTPNTAWAEGRSMYSFIQPTSSGELHSGCFGCVRTGGGQFHEGIDLKPLKRDRRGEPEDSVFAVLPGVVRHVNSRAGESSYGRYVVIEHPGATPAVYSLYAHLARVADGLKAGDAVSAGQTLGLMGRSAGGYVIPRERAHLHFEFGLMVTREFQNWYDRRKFGSRNEHGLWNGMNLMGFDPLEFFQEHRDGKVDTFLQYLQGMKPAVIFRIATHRYPDFPRRYPELVVKQPEGLVAGWEITTNSTGLPFRWRALGPMEVSGYRNNELRILEHDAGLAKTARCKSLIVSHRGRPAPGRDLQALVQQLFGTD
ncbi:MAG: M23 family metallopeptidase [Opitutaceae bacterium]|nr:M23 family metallopeptidase [Opitutaceae bacterium]